MSVFSLSYPILLGCFHTRALMYNPIVYQISPKYCGKIFFPIISSEDLKIGLKLGLKHLMKHLKYFCCWLFCKLIDLTNTSMIINKCDKLSPSRDYINTLWPPNITMNERKRLGFFYMFGRKWDWCLDNLHISHWKLSLFLNKARNNFFKYGKIGWPSLLCQSSIYWLEEKLEELKCVWVKLPELLSLFLK